MQKRNIVLSKSRRKIEKKRKMMFNFTKNETRCSIRKKVPRNNSRKVKYFCATTSRFQNCTREQVACEIVILIRNRTIRSIFEMITPCARDAAVEKENRFPLYVFYIYIYIVIIRFLLIKLITIKGNRVTILFSSKFPPHSETLHEIVRIIVISFKDCTLGRLMCILYLSNVQQVWQIPQYVNRQPCQNVI